MNYYEHHLGDYAQATAHLTFLEDAAYSRLIRRYYAQERALPADLAAVARLVCARTDEERQAVEPVLAEFFELREDGWHNKRCDEEIERYRQKQDKARRSATARWEKTEQQCERNAIAMRTHSEGNAHHTPVTSHHTPGTIEKNKRAKRADRPEDVSDEAWQAWMLTRKAKRAPVTALVINRTRASTCSKPSSFAARRDGLRSMPTGGSSARPRQPGPA